MVDHKYGTGLWGPEDTLARLGVNVNRASRSDGWNEPRTNTVGESYQAGTVEQAGVVNASAAPSQNTQRVTRGVPGKGASQRDVGFPADGGDYARPRRDVFPEKEAAGQPGGLHQPSVTMMDDYGSQPNQTVVHQAFDGVLRQQHRGYGLPSVHTRNQRVSPLAPVTGEEH